MREIELAILEQLVSIKNRLNALKRDRSSYLKTQDIIPLKEETEEQIEKLSSLRGGDLLPKGVEPTRTDQVLDEVCQLLSLSFLSLGKTRESKHGMTWNECSWVIDYVIHIAPAVYSQVVAIKVMVIIIMQGE